MFRSRRAALNAMRRPHNSGVQLAASFLCRASSLTRGMFLRQPHRRLGKTKKPFKCNTHTADPHKPKHTTNIPKPLQRARVLRLRAPQVCLPTVSQVEQMRRLQQVPMILSRKSAAFAFAPARMLRLQNQFAHVRKPPCCPWPCCTDRCKGQWARPRGTTTTKIQRGGCKDKIV